MLMVMLVLQEMSDGADKRGKKRGRQEAEDDTEESIGVRKQFMKRKKKN